MRVPISWLREYVDVELSPEHLAERLTLLGMEVKGIERWGAGWRNVVVGELLAVERHPRADRLSLTRVRVDAGEPLDIVCGATNIAVGQRVPVALPGAVLPGDRLIERTEKMGVTSNGMLCSGDELNLTADADGILILPSGTPVGTPLADLYGDVILDVDVKPNRGDALSLVGLAREVAAATGAPVRWPDTDPVEADGDVDACLAVDVHDRDRCPRFVGRWVRGVTVAPSPDRVQMRLLAAGMRPVSNVVDATNYVMLELGKPIHAFDAAAVARDRDGRATLIVRGARAGERLETLDHVTRELGPDTLVIADANGPLAIAGVMGGATSEVGEGTTEVVVESAIFDPVTIRRTGQRLGLRSEASLRFEKGQETRLARVGADRCALLIREWAGGEVARGRIDSAPVEPEPVTIAFRPARVNRLLGTDLDHATQQALLARVGIDASAARDAVVVPISLDPQPLVAQTAPNEAMVAAVPTWRRDIAIEADVAEEVARVRGYDLVPTSLPDTTMPTWRPSPLEVRSAVREVLVGAGLSEVVTLALVAPSLNEAFALRRPPPSVDDDPQPEGQPITITNPLSRDHSVLRQGLIGSLTEVVSTNRRHGRENVAIFEVGKGYGRVGDEAREWWRLGIALAGHAETRTWNRSARPFDLDDLKGLLELIATRLGMDAIERRPERDEPSFHPGRTLRMIVQRRGGEAGMAALAGELHPALVVQQDLHVDRLLVAEVAIGGLGGGRLAATRTTPPSRHPAVERDLAVVVPEDRPAGDVAVAISSAGGALLRSVALFDIYRGAPLAPDEKSLAHRLTFAADRTLTEGDVDAAVTAITTALEREIGARLRS